MTWLVYYWIVPENLHLVAKFLNKIFLFVEAGHIQQLVFMTLKTAIHENFDLENISGSNFGRGVTTGCCLLFRNGVKLQLNTADMAVSYEGPSKPSLCFYTVKYF